MIKSEAPKLNPEQQEAVTHGDGPLLIVAGAGTGKTTVIAERIAYLINEGKCQADEILALTFTDKAAGEMEERVDKLLPYGYVDLWISTFHAFAERILKEHGLEMGLPNDFKLLSTTEQWMLIRKNLDKFNLDYYRPLGNPTKFIHALIRHFSRAKDENISAEDYLKYAEEIKSGTDGAEFIKSSVSDAEKKKLSPAELKEVLAQEILKQQEVANAYHVYQQLLLDNNAMDFGDLIFYCLKLFKDRKNILAKYRAKFKYILVDEFQDTNFAQYELIKLLASPQNNITVVGDDDQCFPAQTLIATKNGSQKICTIKEGDQVLTAVGRGRLSYGRVSKVFISEKETSLIEFRTAAGRKIRPTDNHKMFCLVPARDDRSHYYVYLMHRQGLGWRLGITNDMSVRLRLERSADRIIGVRSCSSEEEARFYETLYSLKYNIPTVCFMARNGVMMKGDWLIKLYQLIDTESNAKKLADDLNIDLSAHHVSLAAVNRGSKVRVKINLEMCHRRYASKNDRGVILLQPKVLHQLSLETSDQNMATKIRSAGFKLMSAKNGWRLRLTAVDLRSLGDIALKLEKITGGILEVGSKLGRQNIHTRKELVMPAKNVLVGHYLPIYTSRGVIYDRIISKKVLSKKKLTVYDLEVANSHNFIAGGIVVHNSIYKFRGASIANILQFKDDYPDLQEIFLTTNYRSKQSILDLSYNFIQLNNPYRLEVKLAGDKKLCKKLIAGSEGVGDIGHIHASSLADETMLTAEKIIDLYNQSPETNWSDFAILVRANSSATDFIFALEQAKIPYDFLASRGLYAKKIVLDILAYLKLLDNYHESAAMYRVMAWPIWGIGASDIINANYWAKRKGWSLYETLRQSEAIDISAETKVKIDKLLSLIEKHTVLARANKNTTEIVQAFLDDTGYLKHLTEKDSQDSLEQLNYLNQFYKKIQSFELESNTKSLKNFLELMELEGESGEEGSLKQNMEDSSPDTVKIMTVHASKGLEFKYVFIGNMVDKKFPSVGQSETIQLPEKLVKEIVAEGDIHLQEERRLFYVAMTRAKEGLYFTSAEDYGGARPKKLSRFIIELSLTPPTLDKGGIKGGSESSVSNVITSPHLSLQRRGIIPGENNAGKGSGIMKPLLPARFSFSQLKAFENCPYQYRFAYILKVPTKGSKQFSFGTTIHATLQKYFQLIGARKTKPQASLFGDENKTTNVSCEELLGLYEESFIDDWYPDRKTRDEYYEKGKKALKKFYNIHKDNLPDVKFLEYPFNLKVKGDEVYNFFGRIDRVDNADGGVRIVDYKTGTPKNKLSFDEKEQLLIYQLAVQETMKENVKELVFYYIEDNHEETFVGSPKDLEKVQAKMIETIGEIKKGEFPPKPGMMCQWCDFRSICEFRA